MRKREEHDGHDQVRGVRPGSGGRRGDRVRGAGGGELWQKTWWKERPGDLGGYNAMGVAGWSVRVFCYCMLEQAMSWKGHAPRKGTAGENCERGGVAGTTGSIKC